MFHVFGTIIYRKGKKKKKKRKEKKRKMKKYVAQLCYIKYMQK